MKLFNLFEFNEKIQVMDIGAASITEQPIYKILLDKNIAHLTAFDGDERQIEKLKSAFGEANVSVFNKFLFDGKVHKVHICSAQSGMTSIFKPDDEALKFFNGFSQFGKVHSTEDVQTTKLDDIDDIRSPDFLKMDVQGAELGVLKHGAKTLENCLAMQLEVSYFPLYEGQPSFGDIDVYMREQGYLPHRFIEVKRWSISPTIFNNDFRVAGNQLLESDIIYIKNPLKFDDLNDSQLQKLLILSHYSFQSYDLCVSIMIELEKREVFKSGSYQHYLGNVKKFT